MNSAQPRSTVTAPSADAEPFVIGGSRYGMRPPRHHFTVDVEEYFQVSALEPHAPAATWDSRESRVRSATDALLELLQETDSRATFFILGWIAERHPELVRSIAAAGHEVASHGSRHERVTTLTPEQFRACARDSKAILEDLCGKAVLGFRAPSFSIVPGLEWALDTLVEEGYLYDSSLFPVKRRGYGFPAGKREPHWLELPAGRLLEVPPTTLRRAGVNLPAAGGAYFRLLPDVLVRAALREAERAGIPGTFYIHPWEIDPGQPRLDVPWKTRVRHYGGLARTLPRLRRLCRDFHFESIASSLDLGSAPCRIS